MCSISSVVRSPSVGNFQLSHMMHRALQPKVTVCVRKRGGSSIRWRLRNNVRTKESCRSMIGSDRGGKEASTRRAQRHEDTKEKHWSM